MKRRFASLDRHTVLECDYEQPDRYRQIFDACRQEKIVARGAGVSYVAASFSSNALSIDVSRFDRILAFDREARWIDVEAGISLGKLFEFLVPKDLQVAVQPGHPQITVGGCIAANVHGKNQFREGVFGALVQEITLFHPDHGEITASPTENKEIFDLTMGGFGLTGIILRARLSLSPLAGRAMEERRIRVRSLSEAFRTMERLKTEYDMIYCWNDLARFGADAGRGYVIAANYLSGPEANAAAVRYKALDPSDQRRFRPSVFVDGLMPWINLAYFHRETWSGRTRRVALFDFQFPMVGKEFYLDYFGESGFLELQVLLPEQAIDDYVTEFLGLFREHGRPIALTSIKNFSGEQRLLHFNGSGFNFTIEIRNTPANLEFLNRLDDLNCRFGGITNIIKDSRLRSDIVRRQYAGYEEFRERLHAFDPNRRFQSSVSERLEL